jgi:hypothetical protein
MIKGLLDFENLATSLLQKLCVMRTLCSVTTKFLLLGYCLYFCAFPHVVLLRQLLEPLQIEGEKLIFGGKKMRKIMHAVNSSENLRTIAGISLKNHF